MAKPASAEDAAGTSGSEINGETLACCGLWRGQKPKADARRNGNYLHRDEIAYADRLIGIGHHHPPFEINHHAV